MGWLARFRDEMWPAARQSVAALWQRLSAALVLICVLGLALAVLSFDAQDASLNTSAASGATNWLGAPGAIVADIAMQLMGHAVWLVLLPVGARAVRQIGGVSLTHPNWRFISACVAPLLAALALALAGRAASPLAPFPGGALGQIQAELLEAGLTAMSVYLPCAGELWLAAALGALGLGLGIYAAGLVRSTMRSLVLLAQILRAAPRHIARLWRGVLGGVHNVQSLSAAIGRMVARLRNRAAPSLVDYQALDGAETPGDMGDATAADIQPANAAQVEVTTPRAKPKPSRRAKAEAQPSLALEPSAAHQLPPLTLLTEHKPVRQTAALSKDALEANARMLETVLADFGIRGSIGKVRPGPVVTLYELEPAAGVRSSRVVGLADDIARSMSAVSARVAPVPGANVIGIELPNQTRELVSLRELLSSSDFESGKNKLTMALGKDIGGAPVMTDLARMPHLLVAGTTGSGKSVGINTMILSLLYRLTPEQCRLILVDPKMLELSVYDDIPHLLAPVVTEPKKAVVALKWVVQEMENRYRKMAKIGVRNIDGFNERMREAQKTGETLSRRVQTGFDPESGEAIFEEEVIEPEVLPFIVVVIDEMADLMMVAGKEIEAAVQRLAQMARAAGVHLITATQRPSVDVITGTIKANFPSRISFQVTSKIDSRTVLGEQGAEQLLGQGDMLYMGGGGRVQRVHGPFVSDEEVEKVVSFLKKQGAPHYIEQVTSEPEEAASTPEATGDSLYDQAVAIVTRDGRASTSYVQRRLQIGYNRAARLIEQMEEQGIISPPNASGKREILVDGH